MPEENGWTPKQVMTFIERVIHENNLRRDGQLDAFERRFESSVKDVDKAREIQATEYERRLEAYPTTKDFIELKNKVDVSFAEMSGQTKAVVAFFGILSTISIIITAFPAIKSFLG